MPTAPDLDQLRRVFGATVRRLREARGWTQEDLAHRSGFDRKSVNRVETAAYSLSLERILVLAQALDVAPGSLFEDVDQLSTPREADSRG